MASEQRANRRMSAVLAATALCYLVGYPVALVGHSPIGWVFVALGGPFLLALLAMVIHRVHLSSADRTSGPATSGPAASAPEQSPR